MIVPPEERIWKDIVSRHPALAAMRDPVFSAFQCLKHCILTQGTLLLCGNGGSAADADHWAGELLKGFASRRPLTAQERVRLPEPLAAKLQSGIRAIPLCGFPAFTSAFANDVDPELTFAQLVHTLGRPGDVLIGLSTSGNSKNVLHAAAASHARFMKVLGITGEDGGNLKGHSDIWIGVPARSTPAVQELHLPIYHGLSLMLEEAWEIARKPSGN